MATQDGYLGDLTEEQGVVLTVLQDLRTGEGPQPVDRIAQQTGWPGERTYGVARTRRILSELHRLGLARRVGRSLWERTP